MVVKQLHLIDTRWALLIPNAIWVWQVIIARSFFKSSIPEELLEASEMDGCSDMRFIWSIVLPLSKPIIAVLVLMYAVGQWNAYFDALIYLKSADLFPLQLILRSIIIQNNSAGAMDAAKMVETAACRAVKIFLDCGGYIACAGDLSVCTASFCTGNAGWFH